MGGWGPGRETEKAAGSLKLVKGFGTIGILARHVFVVGAVLGIVGCLAAFLASTH